jgi:uncharacterized membrane protein
MTTYTFFITESTQHGAQAIIQASSQEEAIEILKEELARVPLNVSEENYIRTDLDFHLITDIGGP